MDIKEFYEKNRQKILLAIIICGCIFFLFYWTYLLLNMKVESNEASSRATYGRIEKAVTLAMLIKDAEGKRKPMKEGLLSFVQNTCTALEINEKLVNLRPVSSSATMEHVSMRIENLYYDEYIKFIARVEEFDNLHIKSTSFTRRYDNQNKIDAVFEIVKKVI